MDFVDIPSRTLIVNEKGEDYILKTYKGWYAKISLRFNYKQDEIVYIKDNLVVLYNEDDKQMMERKNKVEIWDFVTNKKLNEVSIGNNFAHMIYDKRTNMVYITTEMYRQNFTFFITYDVAKNKFNKRRIEESIVTYLLLLSEDPEYIFIRDNNRIVRLNVLTLEVKVIFSIKDEEFDILHMTHNQDNSLFLLAHHIYDTDKYEIVLFSGNNGDIIDKFVIPSLNVAIHEFNNEFYMVSYIDNTATLSILSDKLMKVDIKQIKTTLGPNHSFYFINKDLIILSHLMIWDVTTNTISENNKLTYYYIITDTELLGNLYEGNDELKVNYYVVVKGKLVKKGSGFRYNIRVKLSRGKSDTEKVHNLVNKSMLYYINANIRKLVANFI